MIWSDIAAAAATLFFVMDPLGNIAIFNGVLSRFPPRRRAQITARELVIALVIMLVLLFAGTAILNFLGLTQPSLNIAGGVLLFIIALRMISRAQPRKSRRTRTSRSSCRSRCRWSPGRRRSRYCFCCPRRSPSAFGNGARPS